MLKNLLYSGIFILLLLVFTFLIGEVGLRIYNYFAPSPIFYGNLYSRYRNKPHDVRFGYKLNEGGYNDRAFTAKPDDYRIVGLGDSFAFSIVPQPYTYLRGLENHLNRKMGPVRLFNMGIVSTTPDDYYNVLTHEGIQLKPDLVLLSFFVGNDFEPLQQPWYSQSYVLTLLNYLLTVARKVKDFSGIITYCDTCPTFQREDYLAVEKHRFDTWQHMLDKNPLPDQKDSYFTHTINTLIRIRDYCTAHNAKLLIAILPDELQVDTTLQQDMVNAYYKKEGHLPCDVRKPTDLLIGALRKQTIPYVDVYDAFRNASVSGKPFYRPSDSHWNIAGNALAAQVLADSLLSMKPPLVLPKKRP